MHQFWPLSQNLFITADLVIEIRHSGNHDPMPRLLLGADEPIPQLLTLLSANG